MNPPDGGGMPAGASLPAVLFYPVKKVKKSIGLPPMDFYGFTECEGGPLRDAKNQSVIPNPVSMSEIIVPSA